ncbi:MAG: energy transducer TonB [Gammaproteobacteria bacterium]
MQRLPWTGAFALAVALHAALALGYLARGQHAPVALAPGEGGGVTVGLADGDDAPLGAPAVADTTTPPTAPAEPVEPAPAEPAWPTAPPPVVTPPPAPVMAQAPPEPPPPTPAPAPREAPPLETPRVVDTPLAPRPAAPAATVQRTTPTTATTPATTTPVTTRAGAPVATPSRLARADTGASAGGTSGRGPRRGDGGDPRAARDYFRALMAWLARHKAYPVAAKQRKHQGVVTLAFTIARDGRVQSARVERGSGHAELDQAALDMLAAASPVPAIPDALGRDTLSLAIPIEFSLITK